MLPVTLLFILFSTFACNSNNRPVKAKIPTADTGKFYPIADFFRKQIEYVDLRNYPLYKITVKDGKKDSSALGKDQFIALANVFLDRSISAPAIKVLYKESVFHDLSG